MEIFSAFKNKWVKEKINVHPGREEIDIIECFEKFGVTPTKDLIALYETLDGKDEMDEEYFRLWSLKEIIEENGSEREIERTLKYGVLFGDYLVNCWCYRINKNGEVLIDDFTDGHEPKLKSGSVVEFFQLMLNDPDEALI